jgi:hypothetical protein
MPTYRVITKHMYRASIVSTQMGTAADGSPQIVQQPGPMERLEVGALIYNIRPEELDAFRNRLELLSDEEVAAVEAAQRASAKAQVEAEAATKVQAAQQTAAEAKQVAEQKATEAQQAAQRAAAAEAAAQRPVTVPDHSGGGPEEPDHPAQPRRRT